MNYDFLPEKFSNFSIVIDQLLIHNPKSVSIVGSYGNTNKNPNISSDLDLIFVFKTDQIYKLFNDCLIDLYKIRNLKIVELGVHFQYGYVVSIYYLSNPMCWVDIGIMDLNFAENYLVNLPRKEIIGSIRNSGISQSPLNQMNHLARKIICAYNNRQNLIVKIACHRYLGWLKVYADIQKIKKKKKETYSEINDIFKLHSNINITEIVLKDIQNRFPEIMTCIE